MKGLRINMLIAHKHFLKNENSIDQVSHTLTLGLANLKKRCRSSVGLKIWKNSL